MSEQNNEIKDDSALVDDILKNVEQIPYDETKKDNFTAPDDDGYTHVETEEEEEVEEEETEEEEEETEDDEPKEKKKGLKLCDLIPLAILLEEYNDITAGILKWVNNKITGYDIEKDEIAINEDGIEICEGILEEYYESITIEFNPLVLSMIVMHYFQAKNLQDAIRTRKKQEKVRYSDITINEDEIPDTPFEEVEEEDKPKEKKPRKNKAQNRKSSTKRGAPRKKRE